MRALDATTGQLATDESNNRLSQCRSQIDAYQAAQTKYNQCFNDVENKIVNDAGDKAVELARLEKESEYYKSLLQQAMSCKPTHGQYSYFNDNNKRCECVDGFAPDQASPYQCLPLNVWCKIEIGPGATNQIGVYVDSVNKDVTCKCDTGYQWDTSKTQCVQIATPDYASLAAKYGGSAEQPKKTLSLSEIDPSRVTTVAPVVPAKKTPELADFKIKNTKSFLDSLGNSVASTSTKLTSSDQASSTQPKSLPKQNLLQKLRAFFFGWWK